MKLVTLSSIWLNNVADTVIACFFTLLVSLYTIFMRYQCKWWNVGNVFNSEVVHNCRSLKGNDTRILFFLIKTLLNIWPSVFSLTQNALRAPSGKISSDSLKRKQTTSRFKGFFQDTREELEKIGQFLSSCKPFPSKPPTETLIHISVHW